MKAPSENIGHLSAAAQGLVGALEHAAQSAAAARGAGYPQIHEDQVGGIAAAEGAIEELRAEGFKVGVSAGERDRMISLGNSGNGPIRVARAK